MPRKPSFRSSFSEMYLLPSHMYHLLLKCLEEHESRDVRHLNAEIESGGIPAVKPTDKKKIYLNNEELPKSSKSISKMDEKPTDIVDRDNFETFKGTCQSSNYGH